MAERPLVIIPTPSGYKFAQEIRESLLTRYVTPELRPSTEVMWNNPTYSIFANAEAKSKLNNHIPGDAEVFVIGAPDSAATLMPFDTPGNYQLHLEEDSYRIMRGNYPLQGQERHLGGYDDLGMTLSILSATHNAMRRGRITVVLPSFPHARQDKLNGRESPDLKETCIKLERHVDGILSIDVHTAGIDLAFRDAHFDNLYARKRLIDFIKETMPDYESFIVVAPDIGAGKNVKNYARDLGVKYGIIDKLRVIDNEVESMDYIGPDPRGKTVLLIDDMIDTGGTTLAAVTALKKNGGAKTVIPIATHAILSPSYSINPDGTFSTIPFKEKIHRAYLEGLIPYIIVTNSVTQSSNVLTAPWLRVAKVTNYFAKAIDRITHGESVSELLEHRID